MLSNGGCYVATSHELLSSCSTPGNAGGSFPGRVLFLTMLVKILLMDLGRWLSAQSTFTSVGTIVWIPRTHVMVGCHCLAVIPSLEGRHRASPEQAD